MTRPRTSLPLASALVAALLALAGPGPLPSASPAAATSYAAEVYEVHHVPTVGGAVVRVEVWRDPAHDVEGQPVLLTYSPYNSLAEPEPARDSLGETYVPQGYARAVADVVGTRGSTGCWDYGGQVEQQSGVDVVKWLADRGWSNGRVAMIGGSYNGTTATMVAARGEEVPELKAIVPIAAISRWYGYAYGNGVRYLLNSEVPTDEGFDTPLAFDLGFGKSVAADPMGQHFADTMRARAAECGAVEHTEEGYDRNPDYDRFWRQRDYRRHADEIRASVLLAHGWQDFNVKQEEATALWTRLDHVPLRLMYLTQGSHGGATDGARWDALLERFLARTLKGERTGIGREGPVITQGETSTGTTGFRTLAGYPAPGVDPTTLALRPDGTLARKTGAERARTTYVETGTATEEVTPGATYAARPVTRATRMVGSPVLDARVRVSGATMHLTPVLYDEAPDGSRHVVARGFQHVDYRDGLGSADPVTGEWLDVRVRLLPVDYTVEPGHRLVLAVQSSNTVWAVPGNPGTVDVAEGRGGSRLLLPTL